MGGKSGQMSMLRVLTPIREGAMFACGVFGRNNSYPIKNELCYIKRGKYWKRIMIVMVICVLVRPFLLSTTNAQQPDLEQKMVGIADQAILSKIGDNYFHDYIKLQTIDYQPPNELIEKPYYLLTYTFKIPEKQFVNELIEIGIDIDGNIVSVWGIPNNPDECEFSVKKEEAIAIARDSGLDDGIKDWESDFHWHDTYKTYVWSVKNTLSVSPSGEHFEESGKVVIIGANSGEVLEVLTWTKMESAPSKPSESEKPHFSPIFALAGFIIVALISIAAFIRRLAK